MNRDPVLSVLVLSEDSGKQSTPALINLLRRLFRVVDSATQTQPAKIEFRPLDGSEDAAIRALKANLWKGSSRSAGSHRDAVELVRAIATRLAQTSSVVVFHYDGDCAWSARDQSATPGQFHRLIRMRVRQLLSAALKNADGTVNENAVEHAMNNLVEIVPFYSVESWFYQSADAIDACREKCGKHLDVIEGWHYDRRALDEVHQPKAAVCLGNQHNETLSRTVPVEAVCATEKSLHAALQSLRNCVTLVNGLARTYA